MRQDGLRQVSNPSELLLSQDHEGMSGVAIASAIEGVRPFLIETQALVSSAVYGNPQRSATGFDIRRMNMLLAVLEKRVGFKLAQKDVFLNIAGGLKVNDPAYRPGSDQRNPIFQYGCRYRTGSLYGGRNRAVGRDTPRKPNRATHRRSGKVRIQTIPAS